MLPSEPPKLAAKDFDPLEVNAEDDVEMRSDDETIGVELSSVEINILIYLYLLESNFTHTAFSLLAESNLPQTSLFQHFNPSYPTPSSANGGKSSRSNLNGTTPFASGMGPNQGPQTGTKGSPIQPHFGRADGKIERGELVRKLWKALRWEEIERHVAPSGEPFRPTCPNPFHLLIPHVCPSSFPSSSQNPPLPLAPALRASPPPAKRPEVFPPPPIETPVSVKSDTGRTKRKTRQLSTESSTNQSPSRSDSSAKGVTPTPTMTTAETSDRANKSKEKRAEKKRARLSGAADGDNLSEKMEVDNEEDEKSDQTEKKERENGKEKAKEVRIASPKKNETGLKVPSTATSRAVTPESRQPSPKPQARKTGDISPYVGAWTEHRDAVSCVAWNPKNADVLATCSGDGTARLWEFQVSPKANVPTLQKKPITIAHKSIESNKKNVTAVCWHPDGTMLATGSYDGVGRLFTPSGQLQAIMSYGRGAINALKFNPSGTAILTAKDDFTVCKWAHGPGYTMDMKMCYEAHTKEVNDVDWLDDEVFASGGNDHTIFVHRGSDKRPSFTLKGHTDDVTRLKWSPSSSNKPITSRLLASVSDDGNCMVWRVNHCLHRLNVVSGSENKRMNTLEWSPLCKTGRMILAAGGQDSTVKLFDALSGECLHILKGLETGTGCLAFSSLSFGGEIGYLAAGGWDGRFCLWDVASGKPLLRHDIEEDPSKQNSREKPMMLAMAWRDDEHIALGLHNKSTMIINVGGAMRG
ncbi:hypothetical protein I316_07041 [Kwoniella heveanensis BCC8398]|uniref:WD40 repeat-like protein n=1 Tax=Kwoniella heveanensis BCC8398 TaxID=1296120 RepID=A0A1B9GJY0_9TREE|nr:hypothetical protein I316_07041 [Kwoniella heveanensis BCC8398]